MRKLILASVILLLLTNVIVLAGVAYNRSGQPLLSLELTERELPLLYSASSKQENSGTTLSLRWQILDPDEDWKYQNRTYGTPTWLDDEKLTELGLDIKKIKSDTERYEYKTAYLTREVILVLEYQGESYHKALAIAEESTKRLRQKVSDYPDDEKLIKEFEHHEKQLTELKISRTRLYVVDAGLDADALVKKYADKKGYLLARGEVGLRWNQGVVRGRIQQLYIKQVHVSLPLSEQLTALANGGIYSSYKHNAIPPRYKVRLNIGKRLEPWIESVTDIRVAAMQAVE